MSNPKDLEGEVDHSFFDSASEVGAAGCQGSAQGDSRLSWGGAEESGPSSLGRVKENRLPVRETCEASRASLSPRRERSPSDSSQSEDTPGNDTWVPPKPRSFTEDQEDEYEDGSELSEEEEESDKEWKEQAAGCSLGGHRAPRRPGRRMLGSRSSSGSGSSCSSSEPESSSRRKPASDPKSQPSPSSRHWPRLGQWTPGESDDTVTDVTPLSTPDISPVQSFELSPRRGKIDGSGGEGQRVSGLGVAGAVADSGSVPSAVGGRSNQKALDDAVDLNQLLKAFLSLEKKARSDPHVDAPVGPARKNYSFSNEEVRCIDRENQRLLRALSRHVSRSESGTSSARGPPVRLSHSALNRQREQRRIDRENMAFLKRLESVKPTVGMRRAEQLGDHQHHAKYLGGTTQTVVPSRSTSSRSLAGHTSSSSRASRLPRGRPESTVSSVTPKASRGVEPRPAWS